MDLQAKGVSEMMEIDLSKASIPVSSGTEPLKRKTRFFYCAVCHDGQRKTGDYRKHLLEHLHKASHELTLAQLELDVVFGSQAFPNLMWTKEFENLTYLGVEEAEKLCQEIEEYLKCSR